MKNLPMALPKTTHIIFFSGGASSYLAAKRVIEKYGKQNVKLLFTDTNAEEPLLYKFLIEARKKLDVPLIYLDNDGKDIWDIAFEDKMLFNSKIANCTKRLKIRSADKFIRSNFSPADTVLHLGLDWGETNRHQAPRANWHPYRVEYVMNELPLLFKEDYLHEIKKDGLPILESYELGFEHGNCFHGDEKFITSEGLKTFKETVNTDVKVLGVGGKFTDAKIKSFGKQEIIELKLVRLGKIKAIKTTLNHRWFARKNGELGFNEVLTSDLKKGDFLRSMYVGEKTHPEWLVVGFKKTGVSSEVFCAVVPNGHAFTLEDNIFTGNCGGFCFKAGIGHFIHLLKTKPDYYFYNAEKERQLQEVIYQHRKEVLPGRINKETDKKKRKKLIKTLNSLDRKTVTILTRKINKRIVNLSLYDLAGLYKKGDIDTQKLHLRYRNKLNSKLSAPIEQPELTQDELFSFGGCGCFSTASAD